MAVYRIATETVLYVKKAFADINVKKNVLPTVKAPVKNLMVNVHAELERTVQTVTEIVQ